MEKLSLLDKIKILFEVSKSSKLFLLLIIFLIFFAYILFTTNKKNKKTSKTIFILIYTFIFLFILIAYHSSLPKVFDYFMNNLFIAIYFPNMAIYFGAIIVANIIILISIFNFKTTGFIKKINIVVYCILNYLLALILSIVKTQELDIFTMESIYDNKNVLGLVELSSSIFIVWLIFLLVYKVFLHYTRNGLNNKKKDEKTVISNVQVPSMIKLEHKLDTKKLDKTLTLDDYKLLLSILKENRKNSEEEVLKEKLDKALKDENFYLEPEIVETKNILTDSSKMQSKDKDDNKDKDTDNKEKDNKEKDNKESLRKKEQSIFDELLNLYDN